MVDYIYIQLALTSFVDSLQSVALWTARFLKTILTWNEFFTDIQLLLKLKSPYGEKNLDEAIYKDVGTFFLMPKKKFYMNSVEMKFYYYQGVKNITSELAILKTSMPLS